MSKYILNIKTKYGVQNITCGDDYKKAMCKYKEIKDFYESVPCTIKFYNEDEVQFIKTPEKDFTKLYNNFVDSLIELGRYQVEMCKNEDKLHELRNKLYHQLEEMDLSEMTDDEQLEYLLNTKNSLTKRRINENENRLNFGFSECFNSIYESLCAYENMKKKREEQGTTRYNKAYYTEDMAKKKRRIKKLHELKRM